MKNAFAIATATILLATSAPAAAGFSTYTTNTANAVMTGSPDMGGAMSTGTSRVTMPDGSQYDESWTCIGATNPPNAKVFDSHTVCDVTSPRGTYSVNFGCQRLAGELQGCVGGLYGRTGAYAGKSGATTWAGGQTSGSGTSHWLD